MAFILDTTFIIDLERDARSQNPLANNTSSFLEKHKEDSFNISIITMGELSPGFKEKNKDSYLSYASHFQILPIDIEVSWLFGQLFNTLKKKGITVGSNDLWIASTALRFNRIVVTRNAKDFNKIPNLGTESY